MSDPTGQEYRGLRIGARLRAARELRGLMRSEVAGSTGLCEVLVAEIESDKVSPTVGVLLCLADAVGISLDALFRNVSIGHGIEVIRAGEGQSTQFPGSDTHVPLSYSYHSLSCHPETKPLEPFLVELSLNIHEPEQTMTLEGDEFIYILTGDVECISRGEHIALHAGDSIYLPSRTPHVLLGRGSITPTALVVVQGQHEHLRRDLHE